MEGKYWLSDASLPIKTSGASRRDYSKSSCSLFIVYLHVHMSTGSWVHPPPCFVPVPFVVTDLLKWDTHRGSSWQKIISASSSSSPVMKRTSERTSSPFSFICSCFFSTSRARFLFKHSGKNEKRWTMKSCRTVTDDGAFAIMWLICNRRHRDIFINKAFCWLWSSPICCDSPKNCSLSMTGAS